MAQVNMGNRTLIQTRLPEDLAELIAADARASGLPRSQFLADLLAERYGKDLPSRRFATKALRATEAQEAKLLETVS